MILLEYCFGKVHGIDNWLKRIKSIGIRNSFIYIYIKHLEYIICQPCELSRFDLIFLNVPFLFFFFHLIKAIVFRVDSCFFSVCLSVSLSILYPNLNNPHLILAHSQYFTTYLSDDLRYDNNFSNIIFLFKLDRNWIGQVTWHWITLVIRVGGTLKTSTISLNKYLTKKINNFMLNGNFFILSVYLKI